MYVSHVQMRMRRKYVRMYVRMYVCNVCDIHSSAKEIYTLASLGDIVPSEAGLNLAQINGEEGREERGEERCWFAHLSIQKCTWTYTSFPPHPFIPVNLVRTSATIY